MATTESLTPIDIELGVRPIADLRKADVPFAGGKGANLGELTAAGLPVPPGFVIGAPVYAAFVSRTGLRDRIEARLEGLDVDDSAALEAAAKHCRELIETEPIPDDIAEAIRHNYELLAGDDDEAPVAVRSSATAEDTEAASFAGMNETFLNVRGADDVLDAVRQLLVLPLRRPHDLLPRQARLRPGRHGHRRRRPAPDRLRRAPASCSRSIPSSGATDRLVIEGSFGLGEAVVSGRVSPDRYVVDKQTLAIRAARDPSQGSRDRVARRRRHQPSASSRTRRGCARR